MAVATPTPCCLCSASSTSFTRIPALGPKVQARSLEPHCCVRSRLWGQESIPASVTYNLAPQPETKTTVMYLVRPSSPETEQLMEPEAPGEADGRVVVTGLDIFSETRSPSKYALLLAFLSLAQTTTSSQVSATLRPFHLSPHKTGGVFNPEW